jgi:cell wall assembly regulator SMI1
MPNILRQPANISDIERAENDLGLKFNSDLVELYSCADGINNDYKTPSGLTGIIPIHDFLSLNDSTQHYKINIEFEDSFLNFDTDFKPDLKLFPFLCDGAGNFFWVDLNIGTKNYNRIFWTNSYGDNPDYLYESLTVMFQVISECYEKGIISLDSEGYLDSDYEKFGKIAMHYNPEIDYWKRY